MSLKKISYLDRTFEDYKEDLIELTKEYYPSIADNLNDASIGSWFIDLVASVADNLSYHIDRMYNETDVDTAQQTTSVYSIARTNGLKVPGPKGAMAEVEITCEIPTTNANSNGTVNPDFDYAPLIKRGTCFSGAGQYFEITDDIDFNESFDSNGYANRTVTPLTDSSGNILKYQIKKREVVVAGQSKIYKRTLSSSDITPFMEIVLPDTDIMNIESVIFKEGDNYVTDPYYYEFYTDNEKIYEEGTNTVHSYRFFEVNSLTDQYRWGTSDFKQYDEYCRPQTYEYSYFDSTNNINIPAYGICSGEWKGVTQKFITEYTDSGYLKIIFGSGSSAGDDIDLSGAKTFSQYMMTKIIQNNSMGVLPKAGWTMFVLYRVGGGTSTNLAKGVINTVSYLNATIKGSNGTSDTNTQTINTVRNSITVTNTTPSVSGKDAPTVEEVKKMIKYNNASQERCITVKDYEMRVLAMPSKYGSPFRVSATEENNKIMLYLLGIDYQGKLSTVLPNRMIYNIENYLSKYRAINDFIEIKSGRIINISVEVDIFADKNYNTKDVATSVIDKIEEYMDVNSHQIGEDIYIGDLQKEISNIDGVLNLTDIRIYNETGENYSQTMVSQATVEQTNGSESEQDRYEIDLEESYYILNNASDSMYEIKYPDTDIKVKIMTR